LAHTPNSTKAVLFLMSLCACNTGDLHPQAPSGRDVASITLTSRSFGNNGTIPIDYTCDGKGPSPQLTWSAPPEGTKSLAILLEDSDAASRTQWIVFDLPPETTSLAEGVDVGTVGGAKLGANASSDVAYGGPCPPRGELHRYIFHVFAADKMLGIQEGVRRQAFDAALNGHLIGEGTLTGLAAR
jgi:Raf kinase inhibitor-like YbhB/YbcL family protein